MTVTLTDREQQVLEAVVRNYIMSAQPTGSRFLSKQEGFSLSAATIRNVMGDLEEKGYIDQPHTSAGRVPTDRGYRYYVDNMMRLSELPLDTRNRIFSIIKDADHTDLHLVMDATSRALSMVTNQLGIILAPRLKKGIFRHIHIFPIDARRCMLHLTIDEGFVRTMSVELESPLEGERLRDVCDLVNQRFFGLSLEQMCRTGDAVFGDVPEYDFRVIRLFIPSIKKLLDADEEGELHADGTTNIVTQPEFFGNEQLGAVLEVLGEKKMLMHLFRSAPPERPGSSEKQVLVSIGGENKNGLFESFSVLKTTYRVGHLDGTLGVLGPKRMPYPFLVAAVDYTARVLEDLSQV